VQDRKRAVVGWVEYVELPDWRISRLRAKMDSGARNSALHVENIREVGRDRVRFDVRLHRRNAERRVTVETTIKRRGKVRASSGLAEQRIFVTAAVRIGAHEQDVELSLVDRQKMIFRMLIGRSALAERYLVDAGQRYLVSEPLRTAPRKKAK
jgi:hypothetical protein